MNRSSIAKRITQAADQSRQGRGYPVMRCWLSDGTVEDMHILEACCYNQGELIDNDVIYKEPHIIRTECIEGREYAPELVKICLQLVNYQKEQRDQGE